jgi:uncharacterized protein
MSILFHLAFPVHDFTLAKHFYCDLLGCELGRESEQALIFNLGGHQIVAHKIDGLPPEQESIYPRHFGLIFLDKAIFNSFIERLKNQNVPFKFPAKKRFLNTRLEHDSFFLKDPSNNLLEFKYYTHPSAVFGEKDIQKIGDQ